MSTYTIPQEKNPVLREQGVYGVPLIEYDAAFKVIRETISRSATSFTVWINTASSIVETLQLFNLLHIIML